MESTGELRVDPEIKTGGRLPKSHLQLTSCRNLSGVIERRASGCGKTGLTYGNEQCGKHCRDSSLPIAATRREDQPEHQRNDTNAQGKREEPEHPVIRRGGKE